MYILQDTYMDYITKWDKFYMKLFFCENLGLSLR